VTVNVYNDVMQAEDVFSHTSNAAYRVCRSIVVYVSGNMHLRHKVCQLRDIGTHKVVDTITVLTAVANHDTTIETAIGREVEIQKKEMPHMDEPKVEEPKPEEPVAEESVTDEPIVDAETVSEEPTEDKE